MERTLNSTKIEKIIEKIINVNNKYEYIQTGPMGDDYLVDVKVKFDKRTTIDEINDDDIDRINKLFGMGGERIPYGTKYYGTIYLKVVEIKYFDEDGEIGYLSRINPIFERESEKPSDIIDDITEKLNVWLGEDLIKFDIDFVFK